jgi:Tfp pilus assembly protein PilV
MKTNLTNEQQGSRGRLAFTLIEVVVSVSVIMITFVTIFSTMTMGLSITQLSREDLRATQIMLDKMEGVRLYSWDQLTNTSFLQPNFTNWFFETNNIGQVSAQGNGVSYTGVVTVAAAPFSTSYSDNLRKVTVTVGWTSSFRSLNRTRTMSTMVSQQGMQNYIFNN